MKRYDPAHAPERAAWLGLDESERTLLVREYHERAGVPLPNAALHAMIHAVVETQLAAGTPPAARRALARLQAEGLDRHEAIHAIASVLMTHVHAAVQAEGSPGDPNAAYAVELGRLTAERWRQGG